MKKLICAAIVVIAFAGSAQDKAGPAPADAKGREAHPTVAKPALTQPAVPDSNAQADVDKEAAAILRKTSKAFAAVARKAMPAVVSIRVEKNVSVQMPQGTPFQFNDPFDFFGDDFLERFFGQPGPRMRSAPRQFLQQGQGSGFIVTKDGFILTNHHVVGDADKIVVKLSDGREFKAKRIGSDQKSEVAVIKIEASDLPTLALGDSAKLEIGEWVIAIGNPFGLEETVTVGVVSAKGRSNVGIADYADFIQTDAAINPGNSGGPLLDIEGNAVGINTAIYSRTGGHMGIGFAIPTSMARGIMDQLIKSGKVTRGYLGIALQEIDEDLAKAFGLSKPEGVLVTGVIKGSAAEKAGMKEEDVILQLDGMDVGSAAQFRNRIAGSKPGVTLTLTVFRDGKRSSMKVVLDTLPDETASTVNPKPGEGGANLGLSVQNLTKDLADRFGYEIDEGVIVTDVDAGGPAAAKGIEPGNLITSVNRVQVSNADEYNAALAKCAKGAAVVLRVKAGKHARFVSVESAQ